ncbi:MAG: serine O-acetyltransferase [Opitutales bacterium]|nr:serine O-acetyltransferase [Opitutales bacterium]
MEKANDPVWEAIRAQAVKAAQNEHVLAELLRQSVLDNRTLEEALSRRIARKLGHHALSEPYLHDLFMETFSGHPQLGVQVRRDIVAVNERDAACPNELAPFLYYKGFQVMTAYRIAHSLWYDGREDIALYLQSLISQVFSVDIHPAARIGCGIMLDHATGIVIGETAVVEDDVSMLHEVTLGGTGKQRGDRHPKVRRNVLIGAGTKILGNIEIGEGARIGAGSVVLDDIPPHTTAVGVPARVIGREKCEAPSITMDHYINMKDIVLDYVI